MEGLVPLIIIKAQDKSMLEAVKHTTCVLEGSFGRRKRKKRRKEYDELVAYLRFTKAIKELETLP